VVYDKKGYPIYPGDLLRSPHYRGARRKMHYLYHVAVMDGERLTMVPAQYLEPTIKRTGGVCDLGQHLADHIEIISGYGPADYLSFEGRPKRSTKAA
jgi:hypothetical protein